MSNLNQFFAGGGSQVGDVQYFLDRNQSTIIKPDGSVWLRSGNLVSSSSAPLLVQNPLYKTVGFNQFTMPGGMYNWANVSYNGTRYVAGTYNSNVFYSPDGVNWSTGNGFTAGVFSTAYGAGKIVLGTYASQSLYYSSDGMTYAAANLQSSTGNWIVAWASTIGKFVALPTSVSNANYIAYNSPDGVNWAQCGLAGGSGSNAYALAASPTLFVALIYNATSYVMYTSTDSVTWVAHGAPPVAGSTISGIAYVGSYFVMTVSSSPSYYTSTDGINWTVRTLPAAINAMPARSGFAYDGTYYYMQASAYASGGYCILYSTDCINWVMANASVPNSSSISGVNGKLFIMANGASGAFGNLGDCAGFLPLERQMMGAGGENLMGYVRMI
ncbi:MAG: hypothetical protein JO218_00725 [Burkholderiales bacterium]|nr:hypothetical protein [Burkholderiales bacterium]